MLSPLSILSLDQGPKWRAPAPEPETAEPPEVAPARLGDLVRAALARLDGLSRRPAPWRYRA
jgi:hypothetical protein